MQLESDGIIGRIGVSGILGTIGWNGRSNPGVSKHIQFETGFTRAHSWPHFRV